eukprot:3553448-Amphidinium_carterae.1
MMPENAQKPPTTGRTYESKSAEDSATRMTRATGRSLNVKTCQTASLYSLHHYRTGQLQQEPAVEDKAGRM